MATRDGPRAAETAWTTSRAKREREGMLPPQESHG